MHKGRVSIWRTSLAAVVLVLGLAAYASAAAPSGSSDAPDTATKAKIARIQTLRVSQGEREVAAARMKLMQRLAASRKSVESGKPLNFSAAAMVSAAAAPPGPGGVPDYFGSTPNWAYSPLLRKFVDGLPGFGPGKANTLGQYLSVAKPDTITYPGSDYYEIELREYEEQMHSDLQPTRLRGYVQVNKGTNSAGNNTLAPDAIHYLGPTIFATKDRPVRVKFTNKLPTGAGGDLFLPVDTSVMGSGLGPDGVNMYTQNRATLHLHGGKTVWISDGTPHQWITPAGENTPYPRGVSVKNVPDMPDPGDGSMTFYYSNQQSARMLWVHDHSLGITRLNVYAGEASGYMITDDAEKKLIADNTIPADQIPLIIQDKTFVDTSTILATDPTWNWGTTAPVPHAGDLWVPHVYVPAQNPADLSGMNATGRWHYGPWFWPPVTNIENPPMPNPYYDPINAPWEPPLMPATPNPSVGMENYNDTPLINGTAYPVLEVDPKPYRLRILNAANDRFFNLQMYVADPSTTSSDGRKNTEVKMVPATATTGFPELWPTDGRVGGVPDPATAGPEWVQIGTESGFLPKPAIIPNQPVTWNMDPTTFNMGNVADHSLLLGNAERADVVVDFSAYAGKTIILYNDAPTAFPALDQRTDYFTGGPDLRDTGGTAPTDVGFGPNTRTIMQIKVAATTPAPAFDLAGLEAAFASTATAEGVFAKSQNPIIVPDARYNSAYNSTFTVDPYVRIYQTSMSFKTVDSVAVTMPLGAKAIQDEQGETFDLLYGRMSAKLGLEMPGTNAANQNFILYSYIDPTTENLTDSMTPLSPVGADGTQIWKITHNGVDTHPVHFHLFDVQVINRVGWDNGVRPPDDNELGWKDTVRISPLEDTIVALKPVAPKADFGVPDSVRPLNPAAPIGSTMDFANIDPNTGQRPPVPVTNEMTNFGWEYVWHCHILSHEEMDMMRPMSLFVARSIMDTPSLAATGTPGSPITLRWTDGTPAGDPATFGNAMNEIGFRVERATVTSAGVESTYTVIGNALANQTSFTDTSTIDGIAYRYVVYAYSAAGEVPSNSVTVGPARFFQSYMITPTAGVGGAIVPGTPQAVEVGTDSTTFTVNANVGYHITDVVIDGVSMGPITSYRFLNVVNDHTIWAFFARDTFTITPTAGAGGALTPGTVQTVDSGTDSATFTVTPDPNYHIVDVLVDGASVGPVTSYKFTNVTANHTIVASFALSTFTVTPIFNTGGSITPNTTQTVIAGSDSATFTIVPLAGRFILDVKIDGVSVGAVTAHKFTNVTANHTIEVTFSTKVINRISGSDRYSGALAAARMAFPGWTGVQHVVVVSGETNNQIDSISAGGLVGVWQAPLLLTPALGTLRTDLRNAIAGMPVGVKVHIIGGTTAVSASIASQIDAIPNVGSVDRISGTDRYRTAVAVAHRMDTEMGGTLPNTALIVNGNLTLGLYDALGASAVSTAKHFPVLLTANTAVPVSTASALFDLGLTNRYVVGNSSMVPDSVRSALGVPAANRIAGSDLYGTAAALATKAKAMGWLANKQIGFAAAVPDALVGGAYMGLRNGAMLFVTPTSVPANTAAYLTANSASIEGGTVFGGTTALSESVRLRLLALIQ